mmetsp:Transcript_17996/g.25935  ORF Transcript_17996/g.25935 Transcript_17996/m.25935 type:complete len:401 (+) Transcript_17996:79-1281(+)
MDVPYDLPSGTFLDNNLQTDQWPLKNISDVGNNDVLYGRGGGTNHHAGNKRFRKMVKERQLEYIGSSRLEKPMIALEIVKEWRNQSPMGRFLRSDKNGLYYDVGDKKAREKTSQALREKAPEIREELQKGRAPGDASPPKEAEPNAKPKHKEPIETAAPTAPQVTSNREVSLMNDERPPISFQPLNAGDLDNFKCDLDRIPSIGSDGGRFTSLGSFGLEKDADMMVMSPPPVPSTPGIPKVQSFALKDITIGDVFVDGENIMKLLQDESHEVSIALQMEGAKRETSNNIGVPPKKPTGWTRDRSAVAAGLKQENQNIDQKDIDVLSISMQRGVSITNTQQQEQQPPPPPTSHQSQATTNSTSVEAQLHSLQEKIKQLEREIAIKNNAEQQKQQQSNAVQI